jgi:hypothetical protein
MPPGVAGGADRTERSGLDSEQDHQGAFRRHHDAPAWSERKAHVETIGSPWMWSLFAAFVVVALVIDFFALSKQGAHEVGMREAAIWSLIWVAVSFVFLGGLYLHLDSTAGARVAETQALAFLTGYVIEKALAVDNIFVFLMLFKYFSVPPPLQKRVLMIGILGALVLRAVMILVGAWLIAKFHFIMYVFGAFLVQSGYFQDRHLRVDLGHKTTYRRRQGGRRTLGTYVERERSAVLDRRGEGGGEENSGDLLAGKAHGRFHHTHDLEVGLRCITEAG